MYGIGSIPDSFREFDKIHYSKRCFNFKSAEECTKLAAKDGYMDGILEAENRGAKNYNWVMAYAAKGRHMDIALWPEVLIIIIWVMENAAEGGYMNIGVYSYRGI